MALREVLAKFGIEVEGKDKLADANKKADDFALSLKGVASVIGGSLIIGKIKEMVSELSELSGGLRKTAAQTGLTTKEIQQWGHAGASVDDLANGVKFLQRNAYEAATKGGDAAAVFAKLGVAVKDANGNVRPTGDLLRDAGFAIASIKNPAERTSRALDVFGRNGLALVPVFAKGKEAIKGAFAQFEELGGGLTDDAIAKLGDYKKATKALDLAFLSLKSRLASELIPSLTAKTTTLTRVVVWIRKATDGTNLFKSAALLMGAALGKMAYGMLAPYAKLFLVFAALSLIVDDFVTFVKGGDSVIGLFLDKLLGKGAGKSIAADMRTDFAALWAEVAKAPTFADKVEVAFGTVGESLVRFFVDDLPDAISFFIKDAGNALADWWFGEGKTFDDWLASLGPRLIQAAKGFAQDSEKLGQSVIDGFVKALVAGKDAAVNAFEEVAKAMFDRIKEFFGIHSPSKVMFRIGGYLDQGLAEGIASGSRDVADAAETHLGGAAIPPSRSFAPLARVALPTGGRGAFGGPLRIEQRNQISVTVQAQGLGGIGDASRSGILQGLGDERRELLEALEPLAPAAAEG